MNQYGRDQRDYIRFRESDSFDFEKKGDKTDGSFMGDDRREQRPLGRYPGINRFGEERIRHDSYQDDQYRAGYDPTYEDEFGMRHPYEHGGPYNRWSDDIRSEASRENHSGKGPKGYRRSAERIREEANEILTRDFNLDASDIEVVIQGNILVLNGEVASRRDKRLAESLVEDIPGVEDVHNHLSIRKNHVDGWIPGIGSISDETRRDSNG